MKRVIATILASLFAVGCLTGCQKEEPTIQPNQSEMKAICELAVMECYYHNVAKYNETNASHFLFWSKDKKFWMEYEATVTLGIDASLVSFTLKGDTITIIIPEAQILDFDVLSDSLTEDSYIVEKGSAKITAEDEITAFQTAEKDLKELISNDKSLLSQAQQRAQLLLTEYIHNLGDAIGQTYHVEFQSLDTQGESAPPADAS